MLMKKMIGQIIVFQIFQQTKISKERLNTQNIQDVKKNVSTIICKYLKNEDMEVPSFQL